MMTKKQIFNREWIVVLIEFIMVKVPYFDNYPILHKLYYSRVLCVIFLLVLTMLCNRITKSLIWICVFFGAMFVSTLLGFGLIYDYMRDNFSSLGICLLFYLWLNYNPKILFHASTFLQIFVYLNLLTLILFPDGLYSTSTYDANWLLGYKNIQVRTILPITAVSLINSYYQYNKCTRQVICLIGCSLLTFILNESATSLVGFILFLLLFYLYKDRKLPKIISLKNGLIVTILFFIMIVILRVQYLFAFLIEGILHKDLTFSNRTIIWDRILSLISKSPIIGYGYLTSVQYIDLLKSIYFTHPHNYILYILMTGGCVLLTVLFVGYGFADKALSADRDSIYNKIILFTLFSFSIMGLTEAITGTILLYPMLILGMESDKILKHEKKRISIKIERKIKIKL